MTLLMPRIAAEVFNTPLMIAQDKAIAFLVGLGARIVEGGVVLPDHAQASDHVAFRNVEERGGRIGDRLGRQIESQNRYPFDIVGGIAIIPVEGTLIHKGSWLGQNSGETSYQGLQTQIARAARDPLIKGVVFEVDSHGGMVAGAFETADMIARLSAIKPTMSILTDFAYSCGYLMASAARQIVVPETGGAGSIGALIIHADMSAKLEKDGVKVTLVASGAEKVLGNAAEPLGEDTRAKLQARVDATRDLFATRVGQFRAGRTTKEQALATEAATYIGRDAKRAGLIDAVANSNDAFAAFSKAVNKAA